MTKSISGEELSPGRRRFLRRGAAAAALLAAALPVGGCGEEDISVLRVGLLPDQAESMLRARFTPLFEHVSGETGIDYVLIVPDSYGQLNEMFASGQLDIAYFGGFTFVKAENDINASPLVMRDTDRAFKSVFLVPVNSPATALDDLAGRSFSFGSRLSTSGHLMPRRFLTQNGIDPETFFFDVSYSGAHDKTALAVQNGAVEAGVLNGEIARRMLEDGRLDPERTRILWETPPYADYVWAIRDGIGDETRTRLRDAFLSLHYDDANHRGILESVGAKAFLPARPDHFDGVRSVAAKLGLL